MVLNILDSSRSIWNLWAKCWWRIVAKLFHRGLCWTFITDGMIPCMMECISASMDKASMHWHHPAIQLYHSQSRHCILIPVCISRVYLPSRPKSLCEKSDMLAFSNLSNAIQHSIKTWPGWCISRVVRESRFPHQIHQLPPLSPPLFLPVVYAVSPCFSPTSFSCYDWLPSPLKGNVCDLIARETNKQFNT